MLGSWRLPIIVISASAAILAVVGLLWSAVAAIKDSRDQWWRTEIARATGELVTKVNAEGQEVMREDAELIAKLGENNAKRALAEAQLQQAQKAKRDTASQCPRLPARCLR